MWCLFRRIMQIYVQGTDNSPLELIDREKERKKKQFVVDKLIN